MEILESNKYPTTRRFISANPGACFQCPNCNHIWSTTHKPNVDWLLNYCPNCGADLKDEKLSADIEKEVKTLKPEASILSYGKF
nr:hypothetical protein DGKKSRWO_DGKKSRWO_CDS_0059 [uncultured phage]CAI9752218.1 hypothetical protein CVNMHQAP_CVNMHQAP_CDS_0059 [uncultured phage]